MRLLPVLACSMLLAACGGGDTPAGKPDAPAPKATQTYTADPGPLRRYPLRFGVSALVPSRWKADKDAKLGGIFMGPPGKAKTGGVVSFLVNERNTTAADWLDNTVLSDKRIKVLARRKVKVPGLGDGIRATLRYPKSQPQYQLYVSTIDGVFVEMTVIRGKQLDAGQVSRILTSVRRKV